MPSKAIQGPGLANFLANLSSYVQQISQVALELAIFIKVMASADLLSEANIGK
jgi:hypothetical protein